jgi:hypothetical protein
MRLLCLSLIALMAGVSPALAGTDSGDVPNPFTEPSAGQTTTSGAVNGTGAAVQPPGIPTVPGGGVDGQQSGQKDEAKSSSNFYQQQKKDGDSR